MGGMSIEQEFGRTSKDRHGAGVTPFRYPGGKAFLADLLEEKIRANAKIKTYAEAYAGGAGAAIELMARGTVERIALNDFDRRVYSAWWAILHRTDDFLERMRRPRSMSPRGMHVGKLSMTTGLTMTLSNWGSQPIS